MPLVRITLRKGTGPEFKQQISHSVHQSLVTTFNIPEEDRFQIIEEVDTENLIWPERYMGIPHSDQIIYVQITAKSGRSRAMKQALFRAIADEIHRRTQHNTNDLVRQCSICCCQRCVRAVEFMVDSSRR
ncbi:MAG: tautomerase family protein [Oceanospirillaceae bacterium]|nr:tautomerase family protein [Oceanospirillaceae bacterium]